MDAALRALCAARSRATRSATSSSHASYSGLTFKQILAPLWLVAYTYQGKAYQVVVNGVTGKVSGRRPWSWFKIALAVLAGLAALFVISRFQ